MSAEQVVQVALKYAPRFRVKSSHTEVIHSQLSILYNSLSYKHYLVTVSALIALSVILLQPLAGALLQVRQVPHVVGSSLSTTQNSVR